MRINLLLTVFIVGFSLGLLANKDKPVPPKPKVKPPAVKPVPQWRQRRIDVYEVKRVPPKFVMNDDSTVEDYVW